MNIQEIQAKVAPFCGAYAVKRLDLFGSAAREVLHPEDYDFLVEFSDAGTKGFAKRFFGLKTELENALGKPVDLIEPDQIRNPYLIKSMGKNIRRIYG